VFNRSPENIVVSYVRKLTGRVEGNLHAVYLLLPRSYTVCNQPEYHHFIHEEPEKENRSQPQERIPKPTPTHQPHNKSFNHSPYLTLARSQGIQETSPPLGTSSWRELTDLLQTCKIWISLVLGLPAGTNIR
jgi:hypothetical protein